MWTVTQSLSTGHRSGVAGPATDLAGNAQRVAQLRLPGAELTYAGTAGECLLAKGKHFKAIGEVQERSSP